MATKTQSLAHTKWLCKYHIVFTPKYRRKVIYNQYRNSLREILRRLCEYKGVKIIEGELMADHVHMLVLIPPKISVSSFIEIYYRPAVGLTRTDDMATGSARSVSGFDVYKAIEHCRDLLENFGRCV